LQSLFQNGIGQRLNKEDKQEGSYKEVFRIKDLMRLFRASILMILFGYASVSAGLPLFITSVLDASPKWLGLIWAANCLAIVLLQAPVLQMGRAKYSEAKFDLCGINLGS